MDIGGTAIRAAVVDADGRVLARARISTDHDRRLIDAADLLISLLERASADAGAPPIAAIGISTAGPVDPAMGTYRHPPNLPGWHGLSMVPRLAAALALPVVVGHDATLAALAETRFGAHQGARDLMYVTLSTGIGAGIVAGGRPVTGSSGGAGEAGHLIVRPGGRACGAGCRGCIEGVASGSAIAAAARDGIASGRASALSPTAGAADVLAAAARGDARALEIVDGALDAIATGLAGLLALLDPEVIIVGGGWRTVWTAGGTRCWSAPVGSRCRATREACPWSAPCSATTPACSGAALVAFEAPESQGIALPEPPG